MSGYNELWEQLNMDNRGRQLRYLLHPSSYVCVVPDIRVSESGLMRVCEIEVFSNIPHSDLSGLFRTLADSFADPALPGQFRYMTDDA